MDTLRIRKFDTKRNTRVTFTVGETIENYKSLGHGIYFYFYFIKFFGIIFTIISLLSIIPIVYNVKGDGMNVFGDVNFLLKTSLGNIEPIVYTKKEVARMETMNER